MSTLTLARKLDSSYTAAHTIDESGARYVDEMIDGHGLTFAEAERIAGARTAAGRCGFVRREADGAILGPYGEWIEA